MVTDLDTCRTAVLREVRVAVSAGGGCVAIDRDRGAAGAVRGGAAVVGRDGEVTRTPRRGAAVDATAMLRPPRSVLAVALPMPTELPSTDTEMPRSCDGCVEVSRLPDFPDRTMRQPSWRSAEPVKTR